jgi:thiamine biosynthesis lipoprotein
MPAEDFVSVSILTEHSGKGDALSTALFCMTYEEGSALVESLPDTEAQWVLPDGTILRSSGWNAYATEP